MGDNHPVERRAAVEVDQQAGVRRSAVGNAV
jgi:hypothetical protein